MWKSDLRNAKRRAILDQVLARSTNDKLPYGTFTQVAAMFWIIDWTNRRIWKREKKSSYNATIPKNVNCKKKG